MDGSIGRRDIPSRQPGGVRRQPANGHIQNQYDDMRERNRYLRQKLQVSLYNTMNRYIAKHFQKFQELMSVVVLCC